METLLLALRLSLAAIFTTAGLGKLLDRAGSRRALGDFGVPARLTGIGATMLPLAELAVAGALLLPPSARWGGLGALLLLLGFVAGIATAFARGRAPDCHCFGQIHSRPAGWGTLLRNGILALLAAVVASLGPGPSINDWMATRSAGELLAGGLVVVAVAVLALWWRARSRSREAERREAANREPGGLSVGAPAPEFALRDLAGEAVALRSLRDGGQPVVLLFTHPLCGPCGELLPDIARWQVSLQGELTIAIVSQGGIEENRSVNERYGLENILLERRSEIYDVYRMRGTPSAVVVSTDGRIASATAEGALPIEELIRLTLRRGDAVASPTAVLG